LNLYPVLDVLASLKRCGFKARRLPVTGQMPEVPGVAWFLAEK
jgi:hypothetical protein